VVALYRYGAEFGVALTEEHLALFSLYLEELWAWNQRVNITGLATRHAVITELFLDSIIPGPFLPSQGSLLDVGSGGGFPGVPLKIIKPCLSVTLLEPNSKRASFLKHVIRLLKLGDIQVVRGRIEERREGELREKYDLVTARAVASPVQFMEWCGGFLSPQGFLVLFLGLHPEKELAACEELMKAHGLGIFRIIPYLLPGKSRKRNTVILQKR
jgi:16S rRNA (guanine527-N7)-methyltransferase